MISFLGDQYKLTKRERDITELIAGGLPARQISERLGLSIKTVYRHIANIYEKMNISSHEELFALIRKYDNVR